MTSRPASCSTGSSNAGAGLPISGDLGDPQFNYGAGIGKAFGNLLVGIISAPFRALAALFGGSEEKIDSIDFTEEPGAFIANALSPAKTTRVEIVDERTRSARAVVPDHQLSLAIGKEGQNARLAARLTGWRIDIVPESRVANH